MKTLLLTLFVGVSSIPAADKIPNPLIDYPEFQKIVASSASEREAHRLTEQQFVEALADKKGILLAARTGSKYELRHIGGAINLPFTDFAAESLAKIIPA